MDPKRKLKIKAGSCRRLFKDLCMYGKEKDQLEAKIQKMEQNGSDAYTISKQREFVDETEAALQDTRMRVQEAYDDLVGVMRALSVDKALAESAEMAGAREVADTVGPHVAAEAGGDGPGELRKGHNLRVCVYGGSGAKEGCPAWIAAELVGRKFALAGFEVVTGGYNGCMEAASKGAKSVPGAVVEGVICPSAFPMHGPHGNKYLTKTTKTSDLQERICALSKSADAFIFLPGKTGTLAELTYMWNLSLVNKFKGLPHLPLFLCREPWEDLVRTVGEQLGLTGPVLEHINYIGTSEGDIDELVKRVLAIHEAHS